MALKPRALERGAVERFGLPAVGLQECTRAGLELEPEQALDERGAAFQDALLLGDGDVGAAARQAQRDAANLR